MIKIDGKMKSTASMVKTILSGMLGCKVETGWSFSKDTYLMVDIFDKDSKYNYQEFSCNYIEDTDEADYVAEIVRDMLNGGSYYHESSCEERYIQDILEETEVSKVFIIDGKLCDSNNEISVDLSSIQVLRYDRIESTIILIDDSDDKYLIDLCTERIEEVGKVVNI